MKKNDLKKQNSKKKTTKDKAKTNLRNKSNISNNKFSLVKEKNSKKQNTIKEKNIYEKETWKPGTIEYPLPAVMVSCGTMENSNIITVAWTGVICSDPAMVYISVRPTRHSYSIIKKSKEFVINLTTENLAKATDWCGVKSGKDVDKFKEMKLTKQKAEKVKCPMIAESPISLECKVVSTRDLGSHTMFIAQVLCVHSAKDYIDKNGAFDISKCNLMAYANGGYYALGRKLGTFGFTVQKKKKKIK